MSNNALAVIDRIDTDMVRDAQRRIVGFHALIQTLLVKDIDYGVIPGVAKPTLLKPGAEKIAMELGLAPNYSVNDRTLDLVSGFIRYEILCSLLHDGEIISQAIGSCSSFESKYRYAWISEAEAASAGTETTVTKKDNYGRVRVRIQRPDMLDVDNTVLKMSQKRAFVSAVLAVAALSNLFGCDVEDIQPVIATEHVETATAPESGSYVIRFGVKHKGETLAQIAKSDREYLVWLAEKANAPELRAIVRKFLAEGTTPKLNVPKPVTAAAKVVEETEESDVSLPFDL
jgi:hypothetical protein